MSADFREKLLRYLHKEIKKDSLKIPKDVDDIEKLLANLKMIPRVVNSQPPDRDRKNPEHVVRYLSRYVAKTAISDRRIRKVENGSVHINYYDRKNKQVKTEVITEAEFMKRMMMHVLPKGFKKVRFFGFMTNRYRSENIALCRMLLGQPLAEQEEPNEKLIEDIAFLFWKYFKIDITLCKECGKGHIHFVHSPDGGG